MSSYSIRCCLLALLLSVLAACGGGGSSSGDGTGSPNPGVSAPSIASFGAANSSITAGGSTTLTAVFSNGTGSINNGVGGVSSGVPVSVSPASTITYTLTITNSSGVSVTATTTVSVISAPTPVVLAMGTTDLPHTTTVAQNASAYFQITGLTAGHRYTFDVAATNYPTITFYSDAFSTVIKCDPNVGSPCAIVAPGSAIWIRVAYSFGNSGTVTINAQHVSAPAEFEGAWDAPITLDYSAGGTPHVGKVDEYVSYYKIQGLTVGKKYTFWAQSMTNDVRMGPLDPVARTWVGGYCSPDNTYLNDFWNPENCTWTATGTALYIGIDNTSVASGSAYILRVEEAVASEGSAGSPVTLNYSGGKAAGAGRVAMVGASYYKVAGLQAGVNYSLSLNGVARAVSPNVYDALSLQSYGSDSTFSTTVACNPLVSAYSPIQCGVTTSGTELFFKVVGPTQYSGMTYNLSVTPVPVNEGVSAPVALNYTTNLPYKGQVYDWFSHYSVSGLTPNAFYQVFLKDITGKVGLEAWENTSPVINCIGGSESTATCALYSGPNGIINVRAGSVSVTGSGALSSFFTLDIKPAPSLTADHRDTSGPIAIQDPTSANNPVTPTVVPIVVSGDPVTSISNVTVELFIKHGLARQLTIELVAPDGVTTVTLAAPNTLAGAEGVLNLKLNDYAPTRIETGVPPYYGTYGPRMPLHVLNGMNANGTWTLRIKDDQYANIAGQTGEYYAWGISFE